ncbi:aspartate kinase [PVC group bacterium]|nr:aspartate kinase [PVC group bacterium]
MALIVQKFGGTSVADAERIMAAARRVLDTHAKGNNMVVVVSARGKMTDELIELATEINPEPPPREMDMLLSTGEQQSIALMAMALEQLGQEAISFTGAQVGLVTDNRHSKARIQEVGTEQIQNALQAGKIVIVAGFQGVDANQNITTLGRGGSDTTAVALAAVLKADLCEIYTDVDGVYTADPRRVPQARKLDVITYDEMLELASMGAKVMHSRAMEFAKKYQVPLKVRSSFSDAEGTLICEETPDMEEVVVRGAAINTDEAKVTIHAVPDKPGVAAVVFADLADTGVNIDMIVQNVSERGQTDITFTVGQGELGLAMDTAKATSDKIGAKDVSSDADIAKLSVVGIGMRSHSGVASTMFSTLAENGVNIQMISTSEIKISCVIDEASADKALQAVHTAFGLDCDT